MDLDRTRWARIEDLYEQAMARPASERATFLHAACGADDALSHTLRAMIDADAAGAALGIERLVSDRDDAGGHVDARVGTMLGPWRIAARLGRGGSGIVYLVDRADGQYEQRAALKLVAGEVLRPETVVRFNSERRILARLMHPNVARLIDGGVTPEGTPYLVMEYVDGVPLTAYCDARRLPVEERLRLLGVVCGAVDHAHRALVVHRDLKPSNIYVSKTGEVKLLDFGIAKLLDPDASGDAPVTETEHRALTPAYAAPEQHRHEAVTTATDVYSLGVVLYELLSGTRPHATEGLSPAEAERLVTREEPTLPSTAVRSASMALADARGTSPERLSSRLRGDLDRICLMALEKAPERRYPSARQLADDIERYLAGHPVAARPATRAYRLQRFIARHRAAVAAAASFVLLLVAFAAVSAVQARLVAAERDRVREERNRAQEIVQVLVDLFKTSNPEIVPDGDRQPIGVFLQQAEARVLDALETQPGVKATMQHVLGQVYTARTDFPKARRLLEASRENLRRLRGPDDLETLRAEIDLGWLLVRAGDRPAGRRQLEDASVRCLQTLGEHDVLTGRVFFRLGEAYDDDPVKSVPLYERALAIRRAVLAPDDPEIAETIGGLATQALFQERYPESRALFEQALAASDRARGGRHAAAPNIVNNYAALLLRLGDYPAAEAMHRRSLQLATELFGARTLPVATSLNNIASVLASAGRLEPALEMFIQAHDQLAELLPPNDARIANVARNIGFMHFLTERPADGRPWFERAIRIAEIANGPEARGTAYLRSQLAALTLAEGHTAVAIRDLRSAVAAISRTLPPEGNFQLFDARLDLGRALLKAGQPAEAESEFRAVRAYRERAMPAEHPQRAVVNCEMARALAARGQRDEARSLLESCVPKLQSYGLMRRSAKAEFGKLLGELR